MSLFRAVSASLLAAGLLLPGVLRAQTAGVSPSGTATPGLVGTPRPAFPRAPGTGPHRVGASPADAGRETNPRPTSTAAERAEQRKLEHDLHICIGC